MTRSERCTLDGNPTQEGGAGVEVGRAYVRVAVFLSQSSHSEGGCQKYSFDRASTAATTVHL